VVTIPLIACKTVGNEQRFDGLGSKHVASVIWREFANSRFEEKERESVRVHFEEWSKLRVIYAAPLIYQSVGALGNTSIPSLGTLKYTISGERPL